MSSAKLPPFPPALLALPDDQLGVWVYTWWASAQAEKLGISPDQVTPELAQRLRLKVFTLDTDNENLAGFEKALQTIAKGEHAKGGRMFREFFTRQAMVTAAFDEAKTGRRRQRANANKPRQDALGELILDIIQQNRTCTEKELVAELRQREHGGVIETVNDDERIIEWSDKNGRPHDTPFSGLKDRMSRARKILRSR
jgi:hypothetical protein